MSTGDEDRVSSAIEWSIDEPPSPPTAGKTEEMAASTHLQSILAHQFAAIQSEQELLAVDEIKDKVKLLDHQLTAAHQAITSMGRGTLFADEVGLGKTIEVGMVLKEMDLRETHNTFLVLTPAQLAPQWQAEMTEKFDLDFVCNYDDEFEGFAAHDRIIASVDTAKSARFREAVLSRQWDVLVLDEAHYVRNEGTKRYELLEQIEYQEGFFATATPIQNEITDLYNIVDLIRPGLLGTRSEFKSRYMVDGEGTQIKNADELQRKLNRVMIRNQREETDIDFTNRNVRTNTFDPVAAEDKLYEAVTEYVRSNYSSQDAKHLVLLLLQKEVVSSPSAVLGTIDKWLRGEGAATLSRKEKDQLREIKTLAEAVDTTTKQERLREVIKTVHDRLEETRIVVFTQFRPTQDEIAASARALDQPVHVVNGDLSSVQKEAVVAEFEQDGGVLVATDAISEGRNMQFCNVMVNYDLPWNPMKVEQRIGRIDRIGQDREVHVFNLALSGTVEEHVLEKLYSKINLFTQSVGGLREILSRMEKSGADFEKEVFDRLRTADDHIEMENNFDEMAVDLESNQQAAEKMGDFNNEVFSGFELGGDAK
ncbi:DEAD/DEAH box helicase [Halorubrum salsamenti]|uniref:DEAD/DEAH box helicase n=1 Tax=Halorubrum salsamenti TaxID=2583990 RepID=UPI0011A73324|nr:SNF2-related protein [Halorubrum salsamenti]